MKRLNNGITLIALVITIIVLLILAGVTIATLTGDNGILTKATESKNKTEEGEEEEKVKLSVAGALAKDNGGEIKEGYLDEELASQFGEKGTDYNLEGSGPFTVTIIESGRSYIINADGTIGEVVEREGIEVGDYVNYIPDVNTETYYITSEMSGYTFLTKQPMRQVDVNWRVLKKYSDGSIKLISENIVGGNTLRLQGFEGYNNGITILNDIAEKFCSKGNIKARSINYEDIEECLTDKGNEQKNNYSSYSVGPSYGHTQTYVNGSKAYPNLYLYEQGGMIDSGIEGLSDGIDQENVNTSGLSCSEEGIADGYSQANSSLTVTQTNTSIDMNEENFGETYALLNKKIAGFDYWIASRSVNCQENYIQFGIFGVDSNAFNANRDNGWGFFDNRTPTQYVFAGSAGVRAIVILNPQVEITISNDGSNPDAPHMITKY